jgi:hypothetical protein
MADTPASPNRPASPGPERRTNAALRELIDEMLASIRAATSRELWSTDERTQYERELGEIMTRVRAEAVRRAAPGDGG